jgi:hypothetical protein
MVPTWFGTVPTSFGKNNTDPHINWERPRTHNHQVSFNFDITNNNIHSFILYTLRPSSVMTLSNEHIQINIKMNVQA